MLVGILSMQRIVNYGSFMQAYSLKKMVESLGHKVVFVDYKTNVLIEDRNDKTKKQELLYQEIKDGIKFHILKKYGEQQKKFIECYPILGISKFKAYHTKVDVLIVGSDEVIVLNSVSNAIHGWNSAANSAPRAHPANNDKYTSLVSSASAIATMGGISDHHVPTNILYSSFPLLI